MNTTQIPPGSPQGDLYLPTGISPDTLFQAWSRQRREALIEMLIDSLDAADGDVDLEPSLTGYITGMDDREGDPADDRLEDDGESGIADLDGYMEQCPGRFAHCDVRVDA